MINTRDKLLLHSELRRRALVVNLENCCRNVERAKKASGLGELF